MSYIQTLLLSVISICTGAFLCCLICVAGGVITRQKYYKTRITLIFLLLSVIISCVTYLVITDINVFFYVTGKKNDIIYLAFVIAVGFLCSWLWKLFIPIVLTFYICLSAYTGVVLYSDFGSSGDIIELTVAKDIVKYNDYILECSMKGKKSIVIEVYSLPPKLLLPLPRVWFRFYGVTDTEAKNISDSYVKYQYEKGSRKFNNEYLKKAADYYERFIYSLSTFAFIDLPEEHVYPVLYQVNTRIEGGEIRCKLEQSL